MSARECTGECGVQLDCKLSEGVYVHHRTRRKYGAPERLASLLPLLEMASETNSNSAPPARNSSSSSSASYHRSYLPTFQGGQELVTGIAHGKQPRAQGRLGVHEGAATGGCRDGSHSASEAGKTPHVPPAAVREAESVPAAVDQRGAVDKQERRSIVAERPPAKNVRRYSYL